MKIIFIVFQDIIITVCFTICVSLSLPDSVSVCLPLFLSACLYSCPCLFPCPCIYLCLCLCLSGCFLPFNPPTVTPTSSLFFSLSLSCSPSLFLFPTFPLSPYSTFSMQFFTGAAEYELCSWHYSVWPDSHTSSWSVWLGIWQRRCSLENCRSVCCIPSNIPSG